MAASRWRERIAQRRERGDCPESIARYALQAVRSRRATVEALHLTLPERVAFDALNREIEERRAARVAAAGRVAVHPPQPLPRRKSLRGGLSPTAVREILGCSRTELDRWAADGRLPADGERFYHGVGPRGGSGWGRAWLPETVEAAQSRVDAWRQQDQVRRTYRRRGLRAA